MWQNKILQIIIIFNTLHIILRSCRELQSRCLWTSRILYSLFSTPPGGDIFDISLWSYIVTLTSRSFHIWYLFCVLAGNFGTVFVDQSYWQSSVAAKPKQGVWGFLSGGIVWFAVPFTFATTMGLSYIALSVQSGKNLLSDDDVNAGNQLFT